MNSPKKEGGSLRFLYNTACGRFILKPLTSRALSKLCGKFLDSRASKPLIKGFVKNNNIDLSNYYSDNFSCFNDCFTRKIKPELRPIDKEPTHLISPCDGLLSAYKITKNTVLPIKQSSYTISSLLNSETEAEKFNDGLCLVFRLCVNHYHRYCYLDDGKKGENVFIPGKLHTVRPIALEQYDVFIRNCREYTLLETNNFGTVAQIEVGAMLVGKIKNHHETHSFSRGEEKGMFLYGGSTVVILLEKDKAKVFDKYLENTEKDIETPVKMGECIGEKI